VVLDAHPAAALGCDRVEWIGLTLGYCVLSALVPLFNTELYLVGLAAAQPQLHWGLLGLTAAVGQMIGKVVFYYTGRGVLMLPARLRRDPDQQRAGQWARQLRRFQEFSQQRRIWTVGMLLASALIGLPPFAAASVLAGLARIRLVTFLVTGLAGRFVRFAAVAAFPSLLSTWWL
jgi:membrane protein YqaA with SNARE-associated domain